MKKLYLLLIMVLSLVSTSALAQDEDDGIGTGKIRERLVQYLKDKLQLTDDEAEKFTPVFISYFRELRKTNQEFKADKLVLQQKIADVRVRYREKFKPIIGEKKSNDVFVLEREFIQTLRDIRKERT